MQLGKLPFCH